MNRYPLKNLKMSKKIQNITNNYYWEKITSENVVYGGNPAKKEEINFSEYYGGKYIGSLGW